MRAIEYQENKLSDFIPVMAYDAETKLFLCSDESNAFAFVCQPMMGGDDKNSNRINVLLNNDWPKDTIMQFTMVSSPDINYQLNEIERLRLGKANAVQMATQKSKINFLREGTFSPVESLSDTTVRDFKLIITIKLPISGTIPTDAEMENHSLLQKSTESALKAANMFPRIVNDDLFLSVMKPLFNWNHSAEWKSTLFQQSEFNKPLNEQIFDFDTSVKVKSDGLEVGDSSSGGRHVKVMTVKRLPKGIYFGSAINYAGDLFSGNRGIKDNYIINVSVHFPEIDTAKSALDKKRQWVVNQAYGPMLKFVPRLAVQKQGYDMLFKAFDDGDRPVSMCMSMVLFGKSEDDAVRASSNARTYFQDLGITLIEDRFFNLPMMLNSIPFCVDRKVIRDTNRYRTMATRHCIPLLPIFCDWKGTGTHTMSLISRNGQLMGMDLYDSSNNFNTCICAQSGSGKSFLANEILASYLSIGSQIWVIDVGRSYEKICKSFGGTFLEFSEESQVCLNPFSIVVDYEEEAEILTALVSAMAAPTERLTDFQTSRLAKHMRHVWDELERKTTIDDIAKSLLNDEDSRVNDIGHQLYAFTKTGEYGRYFNGDNNVKFTSQLNILELEELKSKSHLQSVVLLQLVYQIQQEMYLGDRAIRKLALIDEAWDLLGKSETVADFLETGFRRFRKYNGCGIVITQSVLDLYNTPTGRAIAENSTNMYLLGQKNQTIDAVKKDNLLPLESGGYELLKTVRTELGHFSEIFCMTDKGMGIGRLIVDPFRMLLYSTNAKDVAAIEAKQAMGMSVEEAIHAVLADRGMSQAA